MNNTGHSHCYGTGGHQQTVYVCAIYSISFSRVLIYSKWKLIAKLFKKHFCLHRFITYDVLYDCLGFNLLNEAHLHTYNRAMKIKQNYNYAPMLVLKKTQITGVLIVCSTLAQAIVTGIHQWLMDSPYKGPVTRNMFPFGDVIMASMACLVSSKSDLNSAFIIAVV